MIRKYCKHIYIYIYWTTKMGFYY